jgi:hypothetical protein
MLCVLVGGELEELSAALTTPALTIRSLRTTAVDIPMARPLGTSARTMRTAPFLLIDLETHEGITGSRTSFATLRPRCRRSRASFMRRFNSSEVILRRRSIYESEASPAGCRPRRSPHRRASSYPRIFSLK